MKTKIIALIAISSVLSSCATDESGNKTFLGLNKQQWAKGVLIPTGKIAGQAAVANFNETRNNQTLSK